MRIHATVARFPAENDFNGYPHVIELGVDDLEPAFLECPADVDRPAIQEIREMPVRPLEGLHHPSRFALTRKRDNCQTSFGLEYAETFVEDFRDLLSWEQFQSERHEDSIEEGVLVG